MSFSTLVPVYHYIGRL